MDIDKEFEAAEEKKTTDAESTCCGKCKAKQTADNICMQRLLHHIKLEERATNDHSTYLSNLPIGELADYIRTEHYQYYDTLKPELDILLINCINQPRRSNHDLAKLDVLLKNLHDVLCNNFLLHETFLFPYIKQIVTNGNGFLPLQPDNIEKLSRLTKGMQAAQENMDSIFKKIDSITNNCTPPDNSGENFINLYKSVKALHKYLQACLYSMSCILYPKLLMLDAKYVTPATA